MASPPLLRVVPNDDLQLLIAAFIDECSLAELSPRTLVNYNLVLQRYHWWCVDSGVVLNPVEHTAVHLRSFLRYLQLPERWGGEHHGSRHPLKASSREAYRRVLVTFFGWLVRQEYIEVSPLAKVARPRLPKRAKIVPFSNDEVERLFKAALDHRRPSLGLRNHAILSLLLDTGLRNADLRNLTVHDVDLSSGEVRVWGGKGDKDRVVFMGATCRRSMRRYYMRERGQVADSRYFFLSYQDGKLSTSGLRDLINEIGEQAGVGDVHPHRFRHHFAISAVRAGMPLFQLQQILGHESLEMVRYYVELAEADVEKAARMFSPLDYMTRENER